MSELRPRRAADRVLMVGGRHIRHYELPYMAAKLVVYDVGMHPEHEFDAALIMRGKRKASWYKGLTEKGVEELLSALDSDATLG